MAKNLKEESRQFIKDSLGIKKTTLKINCKNCHFRPVDNICNKHSIKTDNNDACVHFKRDIKFKFVNGGSVSPR